MREDLITKPVKLPDSPRKQSCGICGGVGQVVVKSEGKERRVDCDCRNGAAGQSFAVFTK